jgi:hypothetical protein
VLFVAMETQEENLENNEEYYEDKGEADLKEELISSFRDLKREMKKNKSLEKELSELKEYSQSPSKNSEET